jgi:preprotein translocase subunit SecF
MTPLRQVIDVSINHTLGRTVVTSLTVVLSRSCRSP